MKRNCLIIAEAGVNHNGRLDLAIELCDKAKEIGADIVKFQTWKTEKIITRSVAQADYQVENTGVEESQYDMLKRLELSYDDFKKIKEHCDKIGILFSSTADEEESLDFLVELGIPFIKIGSGDIGNVSFLRYAGSKGLPVLLSTGMSSLSDVDISINALREGGAEDITLLHCTTNYPCPYQDVNLNSMLTLKNAFHLPAGYSDHTIGNDVSIAAVAMGATVIEKHFTLDCKMDGPDHAASTNPDDFRCLVESIRRVETFMGDGVKRPTKAEKQIAKVVTKRIVASRDIKKGEILTKENICVKRNDIGAKAIEWDKVVGKVADKDYSFDEGIM
ncbi:MAG: N-acetylneuraminate synthase [Clostridiales bacterium]|nr:N-acetylneuraminate synthase [Clostridiales bacterium]